MPGTEPTSPASRTPVTAWLRPALMIVGGAVLSALLVAVDQLLAAIAVGLFSLFMAYWTSPLRSGPHTSLALAREAGAGGATLVLWAPGDPGSARLQTGLRGPRADLVWVNVRRDADAMALLQEHGGEKALPLVLIGDHARRVESPAELFALQDEAAREEPPTATWPDGERGPMPGAGGPQAPGS
ncbi:hypothetical protein [Brachybacterium sp. J153]|uniref:hypothetical protein n=1 Tax=Brachybacterium sp. J153 TaxID=3116488 RepID=UPI002E75DB4C|nr:hypothetical protein [Brachybacterium sp. J153]MEE1619687.1 hypothetical protein [Brachybacterium sp. J153]